VSDSHPRQTHPRTPAPFDISQLKLSLSRSRSRTPLAGTKVQRNTLAQLSEWLPPTEATWKTVANQVFFGKVVSISKPFSSSKVKPPVPINGVITPEFHQQMQWVGESFIRITLNVEIPFRGVQKGQTITLTHYNEDLDFKVGDERLFFLRKGTRLKLIERPEGTRIVLVTSFAGSPKGSTFSRSSLRSDLFENQYRTFTLDELQQMSDR
jgi:hypothetical protein